MLIAVLAAMAMAFSGIITEKQALSYVDLEVILLLAGMMSLAEVAGRTGVFDWAAIKSAQLAWRQRTPYPVPDVRVHSLGFCLPRQCHSDRAHDTHHAVGLPDIERQSCALPACAGVRVQYRRRLDRRCRPSQHHYRCGRRHRIRRFHVQRRTRGPHLDGRPARSPVRVVQERGHHNPREPRG